MGVARHKGDFFFSDSCTAGYNHGHNGMFYTATDTEEASDEKGVHYVRDAAYGKRVNPKKYEVGVDQSDRDEAAEYARRQDGKGYNKVFTFNKIQGENPNTFNCSQLIWAAYRYTGNNIELGIKGKAAVYPKELTESKYAHGY
ncbi:hypothetical protein [Gordonia sp. CPCC 205333]|uniref:hypothetical protein n=1 Tax=Gordonia sp. CPCC 205333 TaxID=3140790 RepID=UPI003AF3752A